MGAHVAQRRLLRLRLIGADTGPENFRTSLLLLLIPAGVLSSPFKMAVLHRFGFLRMPTWRRNWDILS